MSSDPFSAAPLLRLPAEIRLQIYGWVIPRRVIHVRMKWTGICTPGGFSYSCLEDTHPLQETHERNVLSHQIPFGAELRVLGQTCRQVHQETTFLPFETFTWAFETAFTLDQWVSMKDIISTEHKKAIRTVAVPTPGPYRSSERFLLNLREILLVGTAYTPFTYSRDSEHAKTADLTIMTLKKDKIRNTWVRSGERAQYAKDLFA
ncbi:hypothetical protein IQ06DRAFT_122836 [Phaeosphaeriaceae sp. SRC1lsM3a]|nr:hypothetical protein IQ06DRAFT_122836 [Stagonospora sp. SRC1lsM3a]